MSRLNWRSYIVKIWLNRKLVDREQATVSVFDHGVLYGDGCFEGIQFSQNKVFFLKEHIKRLFESAKTLLLNIQFSPEELEEAICETIRANNLEEGYVRVVVTRGEGDLGLNPFLCKHPNVFVIASTIQLYPQELYETGLEIAISSLRRTTSASLSPQVKSLNYLNNIMAKIEVIQRGVMEGILLNEEGYVTECTGDNIFIVKNGILSTPSVACGILEGITRNITLELARKLGVECKESFMTRHDLYSADECFLTGTAAKIIPVISIDERKISEGKPGEITAKLIKDYDILTQTLGIPVYSS